jgi:protein SCO1/2
MHRTVLVVVSALVASCSSDAGDVAPRVSTPVPLVASRGVPVPALALRNQDDSPVTLRDFAGRALVVTFVFTRCAVAEFCPLTVRHLEDVRARATRDGLGRRVAFLAITLDPATDTPAVLREYGESVLAGAGRFDQWTLATGSPRQIEAAARFFGVDYRAERGLVTHTLMTSVIGADGRVTRQFPSNSWIPDELLDAVRQAAAAGGGGQ